MATVDVLIGNPTCWAEEPERDRVPDFIVAVANTLPNLFILETVRGIAAPRHQAYLQARISDLEVLGYTVDHRVVGASVKRLYVVGRRLDQIGFPHRLRFDFPPTQPRAGADAISQILRLNA